MHFLDNPDDKHCVDHRDNNKQNNHIDNLRWATNIENCQNAKLRKNNTSGYKGVSWHERNGKWMARINIDGNTIRLGYYDTKEEARDARVKRANEAFGVFTNACEKTDE